MNREYVEACEVHRATMEPVLTQRRLKIAVAAHRTAQRELGKASVGDRRKDPGLSYTGPTADKALARWGITFGNDPVEYRRATEEIMQAIREGGG